uniref:Uncharacterized protein n=1 Tax=Magallana gigas TaxID=29159 RepID=K1R9K6_MAGGI
MVVINIGYFYKALDTFPNANRFSNVRKGAFDLAVAGISAPSTISPNLKQVAKEIIESNKGKGIAFPKPLCIQLPDPVYNTLCLMRTEEANRVAEMEIVTQKPNTQKGTVKETFVKAADLVSLVAQGMCAFCCQVTGREEERCSANFGENSSDCNLAQKDSGDADEDLSGRDDSFHMWHPDLQIICAMYDDMCNENLSADEACKNDVLRA